MPAGHRHEGADRRLMLSLTAAMLASIAVCVSATSEPATVTEAFVTNQTGDSLTVVSLADMKPVAEIAIGGKPAGIAMSATASLPT